MTHRPNSKPSLSQCGISKTFILVYQMGLTGDMTNLYSTFQIYFIKNRVKYVFNPSSLSEI